MLQALTLQRHQAVMHAPHMSASTFIRATFNQLKQSLFRNVMLSMPLPPFTEVCQLQHAPHLYIPLLLSPPILAHQLKS